MNAPGPLYVTMYCIKKKLVGFGSGFCFLGGVFVTFFLIKIIRNAPPPPLSLWYGANLISESKFNKWKNIASQNVISMYSGLSKESLFDLENSKNKSGSNILVEFSHD